MKATLNGTAAMVDDGEHLYFINSCPFASGAERRCLRAYSFATGSVTTVKQDIGGQLLAMTDDQAVFHAAASSVGRVDVRTGETSAVATIERGGGTSVHIEAFAALGSELWVSVVDSYVSGISTRYTDPRLVRIDSNTGEQTAIRSENLALRYSSLHAVNGQLYGATASRVVRIDASGGPSRTLAGQPEARAYLDGLGAEAWFDTIAGVGSDGSALYVTDRTNRRVRTLVDAAEPERRQPSAGRATVAIAPALVTGFAGSGVNGYADGPASSAAFTWPANPHVLGNQAYVRDGNRLRTIDLGTRQVATVAGTGVNGNNDSLDPLTATMSAAGSMTDDGQFLYFMSACPTSGNPEIRCLRKMSLTTGAISTVAVDIFASSLAVAADGALYGLLAGAISRIDPADGTSTRVATTPHTSGWVLSTTGLTADSRYLWFTALETYRDIIPRYKDARIIRFDPATGEQVVLPATLPTTGLSHLESAGDYLYAATSTRVFRIAKSDGTTVVIAGDAQASGDRDGHAGEARFSSISGLASDGTTVFVTDSGTRRISSLVQGTWPTVGAGSSGPSRQETTGGYNPSQAPSQCCHGDPVNSATGELWDSVTDVRATTAGLPLEQNRHFSTWRKDEAGALGHGWSTDVEMRVRRTETATGTGLSGASAVDVVQENGSTVTFSRASDGSYSAPARVLATLVGDGEAGFGLTRQGGETFRFDDSGRLVRVEDRNGNAHTVVREDDRVVRVESSTGAVLHYTWAGDRVVVVTDTLGREVRYEYSDAGDLTAVTGPDGAVTRYDYLDHRIETVTSPLGGVLTITYDAANRVVAQRDALGFENTFTYGDGETRLTWPDGAVSVERYVDNQLREVTTALGTDLERTRRMDYGPTNQVIRTDDDAGGLTTTEYDAAGYVTATTDELGRTTRYELDGEGRPLVVTAPDGTTLTSAYDDRGNLVAATDGTGATTKYTVNDGGTVASETDPTGRVTRYEYDDAGHLSRIAAPDGAVTEVEHDAAGRLLATTDPLGGETRYGYDAADRVISVTDPTGAVTTYQRDAEGGITQMVAADGAVWTWSHDLSGQVVSATDPAGATTTAAYDGAGRVVEVTDPAGGTNVQAYDPAGNLASVTDALGRVTTAAYDGRGMPVSTTTPGGGTTRYEYDAAGQQIMVTDPGTGITRTSYDDLGRPTTVTDGDGRVITTAYDGAGRALSTATGDGATQTWEYDAAGRVLTHTDASGAVTAYTYTARGEVASRTDAAGRVTTLTHDAAGRVVTNTAPDGGVTTLDYDPAGQVVAVHAPSGDTTTYEYDATGRRTAMIDSTGTTTYVYDAVGWLTEVRALSGTVAYQRDLLGRVVTTSYPDGSRVAQEWDAASQLTAVEDWAGGRYTFGYDDDGAVASTSYPNGAVTTYERDTAARATSILTTSAGSEVLDLAYAYTKGGLLMAGDTGRSGDMHAVDYAWDEQARLAGVSGWGGGPVEFTAGGQVATLPEGTSLTYDTAGTLTSSLSAGERTIYAGDARGNRVSEQRDDAERSFTWDDRNRLVGINDSDGSHWTYTYDGDGLRATATDAAGATSSFVWDVDGEVPLLLSDGSAQFVYGPTGAPLAQHDDEHGWLYLHGDLIGSVRTVTDADGAVVAGSDYAPYGLPMAVSGLAPVGAVTAFGFAGEYTDPTGLVYLRARYLDPATAQFLSVDPLFDLTHTMYGYTSGNPLQHVDPLGLAWYNPMSWTADTWANIGLAAGVLAFVIGTVATGGALAVVATGFATLSIGAAGVAMASDCGYSGWHSTKCRDRGVAVLFSGVAGAAGGAVNGTAKTARHVADASRRRAQAEQSAWFAADTINGLPRTSVCT